MAMALIVFVLVEQGNLHSEQNNPNFHLSFNSSVIRKVTY